MTLKTVPSLSEVAGKLGGSANYVIEQTAVLRAKVAQTEEVSPNDFLDLLHLVFINAEAHSDVAKNIATYDNYLRKEHGIDTQMIIAYETE